MDLKVNIKITYEGPVTDINNPDHNLVVTGLTFNNKTYYDLNAFSRRHNESEVNLRRYKQLVPAISGSDYFLRVGNKIFVSDSLLQLKARQPSSLDMLNGNWAAFIGGFEWDFFGTVRYQNKYSLTTARIRAEKYFKKLKIKYKREQIRMFFTLENDGDPNAGFHMHFLIWVSSPDKAGTKSFTESHFRGKGGRMFANTHMVKYDPTQGGIAYMLKELHLHNNDSVDFYMHNLEN
jgi:hypothetical protein